MIDNTLLKNEINLSVSKIKSTLKTHQPQDVYSEALFTFFNAFVDLEQFIISSYIKYALGDSSIAGYTPVVKILFPNEAALRKFHHPIDRFITVKVIKELYNDMFDNATAKNPFTNLFETTFFDDYVKMESVRNVIAHKSQEAYNNFYKRCNGNTHILLTDYLFVKNKTFDMFYNFMQTILDITESIVNPI